MRHSEIWKNKLDNFINLLKNIKVKPVLLKKNYEVIIMLQILLLTYDHGLNEIEEMVTN